MPRKRKCRRVYSDPKFSTFAAINENSETSETIEMTVDEYETIRLIDYCNLTQEECALSMNIIRTTVQSIYKNARSKIADSLVNGKRILIRGGEYHVCKGYCNDCALKCSYSIKKMEENMKIAIPVDENNINSLICVSFGRAPYFLIYDIKTKEIDFFDNYAAASAGGAGIKSAQAVVDKGANIVLTKRCGENSSNVLNEAGVKIYKTINDSILDNISAFEKNELQILEDIHAGFHVK